MPQTRDIAIEQLTASGNALPISGTRVDAAHSLGDALLGAIPPLAEMPVAEAIAELVRVEGVVQLQSQADQLAAHLRQRQQEIDRREAQLNARLADFEKEVRDARVWLAERNDALNECEAQLSVVNAPGGVSGSSVGNALCGIPASASTFPPALDTKAAAPGSPPWQRAWQEQMTLLFHKSTELNQRQGELENFQEKVSQMHREALQLRLAAEEAQAELRASLGQELADQAVAVGRQRLDRCFRDELAELTRRQSELESLKSELAAEHEQLERCYEQLKEPPEHIGVDSAGSSPLVPN